ncbi:methyl-accepting chemotaxis protein [Cohnella mopanensis]|uniref:methyl-accepting chemotaxis protein n=1 Tax=Cohnella mopanensis TaxID=2911966 RepID=UPI001EF7BDA7|nr:methyl-accepting chemotaxis protein [Cohnella mopanensis]
MTKSYPFRIKELFKPTLSARLFISLFASILIFTLSVGLSSYYSSKTLLQDQMEQNSVQTVVQLGQKLDYYFNVYESLSRQVMTNRDIENNLLKMQKADANSLAYRELNLKLRELLNGLSNTVPSVVAIHILEPNGSDLKVTERMFNGPSDLKENPWFETVIHNGAKPTWLPVIKDGYSHTSNSYKNSFAMARAYTGLQSAKELGIIFIEIDSDSLHDQLIELQSYGKAYVLGADGTTIYDRTTDQLGAPYPLEKTEEYMDTGKQSYYSDDHLTAAYLSPVTGWSVVQEIPVERIVKDAAKILNFTLIMSGFSLIAALLIGYFVTRMISRPLSAMKRLMLEGANGKLSVRSRFKRKDEIGQLGLSFDQMMENMNVLVQETDASVSKVLHAGSKLLSLSETTHNSAKEIAAASQEIAAGTVELSAESDNVSAFTVQFGSKLQQFAEANSTLVSSASHVKQSSDRGIAILDDLRKQTDRSEFINRSMSIKMAEFQQHAKSIQNILDVLHQITNQTNILSLNATIEASRAGNAGKGFMVVADEIRKLAEQSKQSIENVADTLDVIQTSASEIVEEQRSALLLFKSQNDSVHQTNHIFDDVNKDMELFMDELYRTTESLNEFKNAQQLLAKSMHIVSKVADQSLAASSHAASMTQSQTEASNETVNYAKQLNELSQQLNLILQRFTRH